MSQKRIHLVIPMSGQGNRFQAAGFRMPKPLVPVSGTPMIERNLRLFPAEWPVSFVLAENHKQTGLVELLRRLRPQAEIDFIAPHKLGPSFAAERVIRRLDPETPVFVSYCDYGMVWDPCEFERFVEKSRCDACLVSYRGFHPHYLRCHTYAFSRLEGERVVEVKEKGHFTDDYLAEYASNGGYYFRTANTFLKAHERQVTDDLTVNGEHFTSLTVEAVLRQDPKAEVRVFEIPRFFQWGTPEDVKVFEYWESAYSSANRFGRVENRVDQILMPMAGLGSRFKSFALPKPLIPVNGRPMFREAIDSLPRSNTVTVVTLNQVRAEVMTAAPGAKVVSLSTTPSGQALSTGAGLSAIDFEREVIVSSCDHGIVLDPKVWREFPREDCDAAIFTVTGYPGALRRPEAYAYVATDGEEEFPLVKSVSVKQPISPEPDRDPLLVGTFWFRSGRILREGIEELKRRDTRVNGELYLDSVFQVLMEKGYRVRTIPLSGYLCWGDPDSYDESQYWFETFCRPLQKMARAA
ncbi:MAG: NTP transferase domain-containing protein [Deltaproteobacteria bacterium]|nr:NTP transferase domain-containing protein [Deltaproteobacteria bacterium]